MFTAVSSDDPSGGVLYLHSDDESDSTSLMVNECTFDSCEATGTTSVRHGGGAIYIDCGSLSIISSVFLICKSSFYGGSVLAVNNCKSSSISYCTFIDCHAHFGGGLMTYKGPTSSIFSSRFLFCSVNFAGGGIYHDSENQSRDFTLSDSLFVGNYATFDGQRGGGAFEDH